MRDKSNETLQQLVLMISYDFGISVAEVFDHLSDALNGDYFQFDSIDMVYFVLGLLQKFNAQITNAMLENCAYWSVLDFVNYIDSAHELNH